jgi:hypothetical protein
VSRPAADETLGMALGVVAVAVVAGSLPATRLAVASLDANFVTAARAAIAGLIALPVLVACFPAFTAVALRSPAGGRASAPRQRRPSRRESV